MQSSADVDTIRSTMMGQEVLQVPRQCAALAHLDLVFLFDTAYSNQPLSKS